MEKYVKPIVIENEDMFEGVFANYGSGEPEGELPTVTLEWKDHDSGSFSGLKGVMNTGNCKANRIEIRIKWTGNGTMTWGMSSSLEQGNFTSAYANGDEFIFIMEGRQYNPNENFGFGLLNFVFSGTGDDHDTSDHAGSYYKGNHEGYTGPVKPNEFTISVYAS